MPGPRNEITDSRQPLSGFRSFYSVKCQGLFASSTPIYEQSAKPDAVAKWSPHGWTIWIKKEAKECERLRKNHTSWKLHFMPSEKQWGKAFSRSHAWTIIKGSMGRWKVGSNPRDLNSELILLLMSCVTLSKFRNFYIPSSSYLQYRDHWSFFTLLL